MNSISSWAQGIIIAVIIGTIIEMILPKGSNSKYVKVVIGIFVLFSIVVPVIGKINKNELDVNSIINMDDYQTEAVSVDGIEQQKNNQIMSIYKENLELDIQTKVQIKGYKTEDVVAEISNDDNYTINKIEMKITQKNEELLKEKKVSSIVDNIESIKINIDNKQKNKTEQMSVLTEKEKKELKEYLSNTYEVKKESIVIM